MLISLSVRRIFYAAFLLCCLAACSDSSTPGDEKLRTESADNAPALTYRDIDTLKANGQLNILVGRVAEVYLPRHGLPVHSELELATEFAESLGLRAVFVYVDDFTELFPKLLNGEGDLIASRLTITESRKQYMSFTVPVGHSHEQLVMRSEDAAKVKSPEDLAGYTLGVAAMTAFWETAQSLKEQYPDIKVKVLDGDVTTDRIMEQIDSGLLDATIEDSVLMDVLSTYREDVSAVLNLTEERPLAWGVHPQNTSLLEALNRFLVHRQLTQRLQSNDTSDLPEIKKRQTLRLLTRNNAVNYFLWRGQLMGFEYELVSRFAEQLGLRLEIIVAPDHQSLLPMLLEGKGDLVAAFLTPTDKRRDLGVSFSSPYHYASELLVARADEDEFDLFSPEDLSGRSIYQRESSAYWETLRYWQKQGFDFELKAAPEDMETEEIIARVASGEYDLTLANSHILNVERTWRNDVKPMFQLRPPNPQGWAVRSSNPELLAAVNEFLEKEYRGLHFNLLYKKYFKDPKKILSYQEERIDIGNTETLSPYDALVQNYARQYDLDWRLLVSQMYEESRFNPKAESWAGARGLMQLMPYAAKQMGVENMDLLYEPELSISTAIQYLQWLHGRFEDELSVKDRLWFTLAAYNAGVGHVRDARHLASRLGLNPNRWFGNVEQAMLLLSKPQYARQARHGYVRGREPVNYVSQIRERYHAYVRLGVPDELPLELLDPTNIIETPINTEEDPVVIPDTPVSTPIEPLPQAS